MLRYLILTFAALPAFAQENPAPFASFDLASEQILADPHDLAIGPDGRLYVADKFGARIAVMDPETLELIEMLGEGFLPGAHDISFGPNGEVVVAVTGANAAAIYSGIEELAKPPTTGIQAPRTEGALFHTNGDVFVMASGVGALIRLRGEDITVGTDYHPGAHDVAEAPDGSIWVADNVGRRLVRYSTDLDQIMVIDAPKFGFIGPRYLDVTPFGHLVVADQDAHRILLIDPEAPEGGALIGVLGDGIPGMGPNKFDDPEGVAVDGNRYFFSDSDNNRIVRYSVVLN